jgi:hypothetical protein
VGGVKLNAQEAAEFAQVLDSIDRQLPFAVARTVQLIGDEFQARQRAQMHKAFAVRNRTFVERAVKRQAVARKGNPVSVYAIDPPGGAARASILTQHEEGGEKQPGPGHRAIAIPVGASRRKTGAVVSRQALKSFAFRQWGRGPAARVLVGESRTVMIRFATGAGLVLQRTSRKGLKLLYAIVTRARLKPALEFMQTARDTVDEVSEEKFVAAWSEALRDARGLRSLD